MPTESLPDTDAPGSPLHRVDFPDDPRIADYRCIRDRAMARARGLLVAEGRFVVRTLLEGSRFSPRSILVTDAAMRSLGDVLAPDSRSCPVYVASQSVMNAVAGFDIHRGCLAVAERGPDLRPQALIESDRGRASILLLLDGVNNHDNVGGVFRSALAFGAGGVLCSGDTVDPLYRKAIRVSMGAALRLPFSPVADLSETATMLKQAGYRLVALSAGKRAARLESAAPVRGQNQRVVLMLGSEGAGLGDEASSLADEVVRIPMRPGVDSLNVAAAAAIALWRFAPPDRLV